jgi:hypothetical protein
MGVAGGVGLSTGGVVSVAIGVSVSIGGGDCVAVGVPDVAGVELGFCD